MKIFGRRKSKIKMPDGVDSSSYSELDDIYGVIRQFEKLGKEHCLDIGGQEAETELYQRANFKQMKGLDYYGDIRCCFSPGWSDRISMYPDMARLNTLKFKLIRLNDIVEHVEWIHQELLFRWVHSLLDYGGIVFMETPNLDYVVKMYLKGMQKLADGKALSNFPFSDHPDLDGSPVDVARWANAALYSGCSAEFNNDDGSVAGDYHHCAFNKFWLADLLSNKAGFSNIQICDEKRLYAVAQKKERDSSGTDSAVKAVLSDG